jgi:tetratricopeptide (TPR) repeat protein
MAGGKVRAYFILLIILGSFGAFQYPAIGNAETLAETLETAAVRYREGQFNQAIDLYRQAVASGHDNASLYYNLGNSYFKAGQRGEALGAYFRAWELAPRNPDIRANIEKALADNRDAITWQWPLADIWQSLSGYGSASRQELVYAASWLLALAGFLWGAAILYGALRSLRGAAVIALLAGLWVAGLSVVSGRVWPEWAALRSAEAKVYSAPSAKSGVVVFELHEGAPVMVREIRGDWMRIQLSDEKQGWVPASDIAYFPDEGLMGSGLDAHLQTTLKGEFDYRKTTDQQQHEHDG